MIDLTTTNAWLAILAIASLTQLILVCVAGYFGYRMYRRAMTTLETVERVHIAPLHHRVNGILDEVQTITFKVKNAQESMSDAVRHMAGTRNAVAYAVKSRAWPILGLIQGLRSAASIVMKNGKKGHGDSPYGRM